MLRRCLVSCGLLLLLTPASSAHAGGNWWAQPAVNPLDPQACGGSGCWTNYLRLTDIDGDDDLDILLPNYSGFFVNGTAQAFVIYRNEGDQSFTNVSGSAVNDYASRLRQVAVGDVDGDGDKDIYAPDGAGNSDAYFINDGAGVFSNEIDTLHAGAQSRAGAARFADVDNDGDLDLFLADGYAQGGGATEHGHIYLNDGTGLLAELDGAIPGLADGIDPDDVDFFDADGDLDLDILLNTHDLDNSLWINDGSGTYSDASDQFPGQPAGFPFHYSPGVCDVDGDEDLDVWVDNQGPGGSEQLLVNDGSANFTDVTAAQVSGNPGGDDNQVICVDPDGDGDFDAVILNVAGGQSRMLENDGTGNFSAVAAAFDGATSTLWAEMGDLDADGRVDIVTGQGEISFSDRVYFGTMMVTVDVTPPHIRGTVEQVEAEVAADAQPIVRFAVSDETVTDEGPLLSSAFVRVTVDGADTDVPAMFMGGDLFRAVLPAQPGGGTIAYAACAVDRQGNEGCAEALMYDVAGGADSTGGSGGSATGGSATSGPTTTVDDSGSATVSASATDGSATGSATDSAETDGQSGGDDGGGGCTCRNGSGSPPMLVLPLFGMATALVRRRRRRVPA